MAKILVVEDDNFLREMVCRKLKKEGYEVVSTMDGEEGIEKIKEEKPDLVLLDLILPGINGYKVLEEVKAEPEVKETPVIILSNLGQNDEINKGLNLGATDFLIKAHFTPPDVIDKIKEIIGE